MSYTGLLSDSYGDFSSTYDTGGVSAPDVSVTSPVDSSTMTASELAGNGADYVSQASDAIIAAFGPNPAPSEANGYNTEGWATSGIDAPEWYLNGEPAPEAETSVVGGLWEKFKSLDGKTQSVLASSLFSAIGGVMKNDTAKDKLRQDQQVLDLKRQQQDNAMRSTAESYDKSKYKVRGLLNPEAKLTYSTQTGVKK